MNKRLLGIVCATSGAACWGVSGASAQVLFGHGVSTTWLVALRLLTAGLGLLIVSLVIDRKGLVSLVTHRQNWVWLVAFAFFGMLNSQWSYFWAIDASNAPTATVLQFLQPVIIILWGTLKQRHLPRGIDIISVICALVGTVLLATGGNLSQLSLTPRALFWGIWCAVAAALYTLLPQDLLRRYNAMSVSAVGMLISGVAVFPQMLHPADFSHSATDWLWIGYIIVGGTMLAYTLFLQSLRYISAATTGMLSAFEPLVATIIAVGWLHTDLSAAALVGSGLIILTTIIQALPLQLLQQRYRHWLQKR